MDQAMTTTTFELSGYRVSRTLGVVRGITVRSRSIFGTIGGSLQTLVGGLVGAAVGSRGDGVTDGIDGGR